MDSFVKQHLFTMENITLFYLSPYCVVYETPEGIYLDREDLNKSLVFNANNRNNDNMIELLKRLKIGMREDELVGFLENEIGEEDAAEWIKYCIQGGVIE